MDGHVQWAWRKRRVGAVCGKNASVRGGVVLGGLRARVEDFEAAVGPGGEFQIVAGVRSGKIGDERLGHIMGSAAFIGKMELPDILETRRLFDGFPGGRRGTYCGAVVHNGDAGSDAIQKERAVAGDRTVMIHNV